MARTIAFLAFAAASVSACATASDPGCISNLECPSGRCDPVSGRCLPPADADADPDGPACDLATCFDDCLLAGYIGGVCVGVSCQCTGTPSDGGGEETDATAGPDDAGETEGDAATDDAAPGDDGTDIPETIDDGTADDGADADADADDADIRDDGAADDGAACPPGHTFCVDGCYDTSTDPARCGSCTRACRSDQACVGGACLCPGGYADCAGRCTDLSNDSTNCGWCGNACGAGRACVSGSCVCTGGRTDCFGACVDMWTDPSHCGWCGNNCAGGSCSGGVCTVVTADFTFPNTGDTYFGPVLENPYLWRLGNYLQGTRSTSLSSATQVTFTLYTNVGDINRLTCDSLDLTVMINGVSVGAFQFPPFTSSVSRTFGFGAIAGPTYTIRLQVARQVSSGCGAIAFTADVSPWTLRM